jgi:hypothetical protein
MKTALVSWILTMMLGLEPNTPWRSTYESTADAIATSSIEAPLFSGTAGAAKTASLLVSVAWFEGTFKPDAEGDCVDATGHRVEKVPGRLGCPTGTTPKSLCVFQINTSNFAGLGVTTQELQTDVRVCTKSANRMLHRSFQICHARPLEDRLGWYAAGGPDCSRGLTESRHRVRKATWLFAAYGPTLVVP